MQNRTSGPYRFLSGDLKGDIGDRYRRSDAERDHQEVKADLRRESDNIEERVQAISGRLHSTETEIRMLAHLQKDIEKLDDRVREIEKQAPEFLNDDLRELQKQVREHELKKGHK